MLALPKWQAIAAIVGASVAGSLLITAMAFALGDAPASIVPVGMAIAAIVPTLVAGPVAWVLLRLLHELQASRALAQTLASTDALTGALNRRKFIETGQLLVQRARLDASPTSLVLMDIDDFKRINDRYGHSAGDEVLKMFARQCRVTLRPSDMLARWGGEEFVALLPATAPDDAVHICDRLCQAIAQGSVELSEVGPMRVTVSIGVASTDTRQSGLEELLSRADAAMYHAKRAGKNGVRLAA